MATAYEQQYIGKYVKKLQQLTLTLKVYYWATLSKSYLSSLFINTYT